MRGQLAEQMRTQSSKGMGVVLLNRKLPGQLAIDRFDQLTSGVMQMFEAMRNLLFLVGMEVSNVRSCSYELLKGFLETFNHHDLDSIMGYFADNCVFYMPRGARPRGNQYIGKNAVRAGLTKRFEGIPDVYYGDDQHWVCDNFGVSEWTLTGTSVSGQHIEVRGVDLQSSLRGRSPARILSG